MEKERGGREVEKMFAEGLISMSEKMVIGGREAGKEGRAMCIYGKTSWWTAIR